MEVILLLRELCFAKRNFVYDLQSVEMSRVTPTFKSVIYEARFIIFHLFVYLYNF